MAEIEGSQEGSTSDALDPAPPNDGLDPDNDRERSRSKFRSRVLEFTTLGFYYAFGAGIWYKLEGWSVLDSCYFMTTTMSTVGYGDIAPVTNGGKWFGIFYMFVGIGVIFQLVAKAANGIIAAATTKIEILTDDDLTDNHKPYAGKLAFNFLLVAILLTVGAVFVAMEEDLTALNAVWWATCTITTVGYGDIGVTRESTKIFITLYIFMGAIVGSSAIGTVMSVREQILEERREASLLARLDYNMLRSMDETGNGVDMNEYVLGMLLLMEDVPQEKVEFLRKQFREQDKDGSGILTREDLEHIAMEKEAKRERKLTKTAFAHAHAHAHATLRHFSRTVSQPPPRTTGSLDGILPNYDNREFPHTSDLGYVPVKPQITVVDSPPAVDETITLADLPYQQKMFRTLSGL